MFVGGGILLYVVSLMGGPSAGHQHGMRGPHHPRGNVVAHHHYSPHRHDGGMGEVPKLTQDTQLLHDAEHIREDLGEWVSKVDTQKMTPEELEFHYFKLHDFDNNTKLDGLEILQAIHHTVHNVEESQHEDAPDQGHTESQAEDTHSPNQDDFDYFIVCSAIALQAWRVSSDLYNNLNQSKAELALTNLPALTHHYLTSVTNNHLQ